METRVPAIRFVRCPKCLKILTELADVPVYKCGGCGIVLRAKTLSSNGVNVSSLSAIPISQTLPNIDPLSTESESLSHKTSASDATTMVDQAEVGNFNTICMEKSLEHEKNDIKSFISSPLTLEAERELSKFEGAAFIGENFEEGDGEDQISHTVSPEVFESQKPSDKFEVTSKLMMASRSPSHAYDASASSTEEDRKDSMLRLSRRTIRNKFELSSINNANSGENFIRRFTNERFHSARNCKLKSSHDGCQAEQGSISNSQFTRRNSIGSTVNGLSNYSTNNTEDEVNNKFLEHNNQTKILNQVNELRNELRGMFSDTAGNKDSSLIAMKPSQFLGKVPSKEHRSSLFPFHREPNSCCHFSGPAILPLQKQYSTIHHETTDLQFKFSKPQTGFRLCRPVSGGAPFIACYKCLNLLQLPMDFLISSKKINKLRCGACSQVLMYCFRPICPSSPNEDNLTDFYIKNACWDPISSSSDSNSSQEVEKQIDNRDLRGTRLHSLMGYCSVSELLFSNECFADC